MVIGNDKTATPTAQGDESRNEKDDVSMNQEDKAKVELQLGVKGVGDDVEKTETTIDQGPEKRRQLENYSTFARWKIRVTDLDQACKELDEWAFNDSNSSSDAPPIISPDVFQPHVVGYGGAACGCPFCKLKQAYQKSVVVFQAAQKKRKATGKKQSRAVRLMLRKHEENGNMEFTQEQPQEQPLIQEQERTREEEPMMSDAELAEQIRNEWKFVLNKLDTQTVDAFVQKQMTNIKTDREHWTAKIKAKDAASAAALEAAKLTSAAALEAAKLTSAAALAAGKVASAAKNVLMLAQDILLAHQDVDSKSTIWQPRATTRCNRTFRNQANAGNEKWTKPQ